MSKHERWLNDTITEFLNKRKIIKMNIYDFCKLKNITSPSVQMELVNMYKKRSRRA